MSDKSDNYGVLRHTLYSLLPTPYALGSWSLELGSWLRVNQLNVIGIGIKVTIKMIKAMTANNFSFIVKGVIQS